MKIRTTIFIMFLLMAIIPFGILGLVDMQIYEKQTKKILQNDLGVATITQVQSIQNFIYERDVNMSVISELSQTQQILADSNAQRKENVKLRRSVDEMLRVRSAKNDNVIAVSVFDKNYKLVSNSSRDIEKHLADGIDKIDFNKEGHTVQFTPISTDADGKKHLSIVKEIIVNGEVLGYISEMLNMNYFEKARQAVSLFNNGTIYLYDGYGSIITAGRFNESIGTEITTKSERAGFNKAWQERDVSKNHGNLEYKVKGKDYISYYSGIEGTDWMMITTVDLSQVLQNQLRIRFLCLFLIVLVAIGMVLINFIVSNKVVKPMNKMIGKFSEIQRQNDYSIRLDKVSKSELGTISGGINDLLANIEQHIEKEHKQQSELIIQATHDSLTGLYNKKTMDNLISQTLNKANEQKRKIALLFIDVDNFKSFNTIYGHNGGDSVLRFVGDTLKETSELSGRMGGDEFVVCYDKEEQMGRLTEIAENLLKAFEKGTVISQDNIPVQISCSIGVAISKGENQSYEELISIADSAMYLIKGSGKNGYDITS